jgi:4-amino-4-deoxy-L-arabinose transferase-like glycosyltransferase
VTRPLARSVVLAAAAAIAATAIAVRFWNVGWGLDRQMAFTDELQMWPPYLGAFAPLRLESFLRKDTPGAMIYPAFYGFLSGGSAALVHALGLMGHPRTDVFHALLLARLITATAGTLNVLAVGALGWRCYSPQAGLLAAALMAVVPLEVMQAHYASADPLLGLCITLALLLACELARRGSAGMALLAGAASGLAFSAKYTGLVALGAASWAILEIAVRDRSPRPLVRLVPALLAGFVVAVTIACPPCVLQSDLMLRAMRFHSATSSFAHLAFWNVHLAPTLGWYGRPYLYQLVAGLPYALGWPLYLTALAGVVHAARRRTANDRILLVTAGAYFLTIGTSSVLEAHRYYIPLFPALVVLAARWLLTLRRVRVRAVVAGAVLAYTAVLSASQVARFSYDQQHQVAAWIKENVRPASGPVRVGLPQGIDPYFNLRQPLVWAGLQPLPLPVDRWFDEEADVFVMPDWLAIRIRRDQPDGDAARALERLESGAAGYAPAARWHSSYLQSGFYTSLDPGFDADLVQGEIGFTVYVRRRS